MSYSFSVHGATKDEVMRKVATQLDNVVAGQSIHSVDRKQAEATVKAFLDIVPVTDNYDFNVSVSGSVSWSGNMDDHKLMGASVNVSVSLIVNK